VISGFRIGPQNKDPYELDNAHGRAEYRSMEQDWTRSWRDRRQERLLALATCPERCDGSECAGI